MAVGLRNLPRGGDSRRQHRYETVQGTKRQAQARLTYAFRRLVLGCGLGGLGSTTISTPTPACCWARGADACGTILLWTLEHTTTVDIYGHVTKEAGLAAADSFAGI